MRNAPLALIAAGVLFACAHPAATPHAPAATSDVEVEGFSLPRHAGGFDFESTQTFGDPLLGTGIHYEFRAIENLRADLFIYPIALEPGHSLADVLDEQQAMLASDVLQHAQSLGGEAAGIAEESYTAPGATPPLSGIRTEFAIDLGEERLVSHAFIGVRGRDYLKVRFTYPAGAEPAGRTAFEHFLADVVAAALEKDPKPIAFTTTIYGGTAIEIAGHKVVCAGMVWGLGYGSSIWESFQQEGFLDSYQRELRARSKALDVWELFKSKGIGDTVPATSCVESFLDAMREVRKRGLLEEYVWHYFAKPYWEKPPDLDMVAFEKWEKAHLAGHDPVFNTGVAVVFEDAEATPGTKKSER